MLRALTALSLLCLSAPTFAQDAEAPSSIEGLWTDGSRIYSLMPNGFGAVQYERVPGPFAVWRYRYENGVLSFTDIDGFSPCVGMTAHYSVSTTDTGLLLVPIEEPCEARRGPEAVPLEPYTDGIQLSG